MTSSLRSALIQIRDEMLSVSKPTIGTQLFVGFGEPAERFIKGDVVRDWASRLSALVDPLVSEGAQEIRVGDIIELNGRQLRVSECHGAVCRDGRGRVAVRNVETERLSYVSEWRLLKSKRQPTAAPQGEAPSPWKPTHEQVLDAVGARSNEIEMLRKALRNVRLSAAEARTFGHSGTPTLEAQVAKKNDKLDHILRFCAEAGEAGSILRAAQPDPPSPGSLP